MNQRIRAIDWLRGIAVLVMIQTHALVLVKPALRAGALFSTLQWIDGLVAPSFIFAAGFSLALTQVRAALKDNAPDARRRRFRRTLRRIMEVLAVATLTNWAWFPIFREPKWLIRIDILHCIGFSLLIALPILALLAPRPRAMRWCTLALAAVVFGAAPFFEHVAPPLGHFLNAKDGSVFPLFPWGGYVYLGASIGAVCAADGWNATVRWLAGIAVIGILLWIFTAQVAGLYPPHEFWVTDPANHARRWTQVCAIGIALLAVERFVPGAWRTSLAIRFVEVFGTSSLAGYFIHEMLLYYRIRGLSFQAIWGEQLSWGGFVPVLGLLIAMTFAITWLIDQVYRRVDAAISSGSGAATVRTAQ